MKKATMDHVCTACKDTIETGAIYQQAGFDLYCSDCWVLSREEQELIDYIEMIKNENADMTLELIKISVLQDKILASQNETLSLLSNIRGYVAQSTPSPWDGDKDAAELPY